MEAFLHQFGTVLLMHWTIDDNDLGSAQPRSVFCDREDSPRRRRALEETRPLRCVETGDAPNVPHDTAGVFSCTTKIKPLVEELAPGTTLGLADRVERGFETYGVVEVVGGEH